MIEGSQASRMEIEEREKERIKWVDSGWKEE